MFKLRILSALNIKQKYMYYILYFSGSCSSKSFTEKTHSQYITNSWREDPQTRRFSKNQVKFVNFRIKWAVLPQNHVMKKQNAIKLNEVKFTNFPVIKNAIE